MNHTEHTLHRYLKKLSVTISYESIKQLLNASMGNSIRGISDALEELHIEHEVYQLPAEYLEKNHTTGISLNHFTKQEI